MLRRKDEIDETLANAGNDELTLDLELYSPLPVFAGLTKDKTDDGARGAYAVVALAGAVPAAGMAGPG